MNKKNVILLTGIIIAIVAIVLYTQNSGEDWVENANLSSQYNSHFAIYENGEVQCLLIDTFSTVYTKDSEDYVKVCGLDMPPGHEYAHCNDEIITLDNNKVVTNWLGDFEYDSTITEWIAQQQAGWTGWGCTAYSCSVGSFTSVKLYSTDGYLPPDARSDYAYFIATGIWFGDHIEFCDFTFPWEM